jgi:DNA-binding LacI/PurR family transcriptional regulator
MMLWLGNRSKEKTLDQILGMGLLDGVIVSADQADDVLVDGLLASDLPTVLVGHRRDDHTASYVDVDHILAADQVTSHLIDLGRRRVGHIIGRAGAVAAIDRLAGYRQAMERAGLDHASLVEPGDFNVESGRAGAETLIERGVDAIFCANDATALGALYAIRERGLEVPGDIALAGFDDLKFAAEMDPPLTTVRQGVEQQGIEAALTLIALLKDPKSGPRRVILPTELIIRRSTVGLMEERSP